MFNFLITEVLPKAKDEEADNLHAFNLERAIDNTVSNGCDPFCGCSHCASLLLFQDWCTSLPHLPSTFTDLLKDYHSYEESKFPPTSEAGYMDFASSNIHNAFKGIDCSTEFDAHGAITCQGLFDDDCEPTFLCLSNESLTRIEIREAAQFMSAYIKDQLNLPDRNLGSRFSSDYRIGSEVLTSQLEKILEAKLRSHSALKHAMSLSGATNPDLQSAKEKILNQQDKIVWLGKNTGNFEGHQDSLDAKRAMITYLADVGVYSPRTVDPIATSDSPKLILGKTKIIMGLKYRYSRRRLFSAFQPNFFSNGDPLLWVGRNQGTGGHAIKLVNNTSCHSRDHATCDCGRPAEFEAVGSLKNIRWSKPEYKLLKVCVFGQGELADYAPPPLDAIRAKN